jgi:hypothetical protein
MLLRHLIGEIEDGTDVWQALLICVKHYLVLRE